MKVDLAAARRWLEAVLRQTGKLPTEIARDAGLSSTTLTRPLNNPAHQGGVSVRTLRAVSKATGVPLPRELDFPQMTGDPAAGHKPDTVELSIRLAQMLPTGVALDDDTRTEIIRQIVALADRYGLVRKP